MFGGTLTPKAGPFHAKSVGPQVASLELCSLDPSIQQCTYEPECPFFFALFEIEREMNVLPML